MKLLVNGYVPNFKDFKLFYPAKEQENKGAICNLKVNVSYDERTPDGKYEKKSELVELVAFGKQAEFLNEYKQKDFVACLAEFNGLNVYTSKQNVPGASIKAKVVEMYGFAPKSTNVPQATDVTPPTAPAVAPPQTAPYVPPVQPQTTPPAQNQSSGRTFRRQ